MPWLNVPHQVEQQPGWCLPACAAMVTAYWEQPLAQEDIARWLDTRPVGTPASRIVRLARRGFDIIYTSGAPATLVEWLNQGVPPILFVRTGDLQPHWTIDTPHAVVLAGIEGDTCVLFDPGLEVGARYRAAWESAARLAAHGRRLRNSAPLALSVRGIHAAFVCTTHQLYSM